MSQREGETNYKYEDYASDMAFHRLPQSVALVGQKLRVSLDSGTSYDLDVIEQNRVSWRNGNKSSTDWCEVVEVAPHTYFFDMTFKDEPRHTQTFILNTVTR